MDELTKQLLFEPYVRTEEGHMVSQVERPDLKPSYPFENKKKVRHTNSAECPTWDDYYYAGWFGCDCHQTKNRS